MRVAITVLVLCALSACAKAPIAGPTDRAAANRIEADVRYLADDALEGREAGTRGFDMAADYVAQRYQEIGLQPAGDAGTWFQQVPLLKATREQEGARLQIDRGGHAVSLRFQEQFLPALNYNAAVHALTAPAVFVGQGVHAPALQHDDFAGVEVGGKIAIVLGGAPARFDKDRRAFHSSSREKQRELAERGAVGVVFVSTDADELRSPWVRSSARWQKAGMRLRGTDGKGIDAWPQLQAGASVSAAAAQLLFDGGPHTAGELFAQAKAGTLRAFDLPGTITLAGRTRIEPTQTRNVVGKFPGSGGTASAEHIVYTAHLDHVGIGAPVDGDSIYNGALDNALGVAIMIEAARELLNAAAVPARSMLFVALTAAEKGLLGAEWFAAHPPVPRQSLVANINVDMPVMLVPSRDVVPIGIEHSSLQAAVETAAGELGLSLSPDPYPEEVVFVRSDQYAFIRAGIPAVYLTGGMEHVRNGADPKAALQEFLRDCYHQPCDDASQPIQYGDAAHMAKLNARVGRLIADDPARPRWNTGDFFGETFASASPKP
ncbi:MAG: M28 family peptidase [Pseudomonadota bacterium]|nr:M28 family peptidase [Pseudomonadota bacterium]